MAKRGGLGKGLDSLIPLGVINKDNENSGTKKVELVAKKDSEVKPARVSAKAKTEKEAAPESDDRGVTYLKISKVEPNRDQPRKQFDEAALNELAESIKQYGVLQPLIVQKNKNYYEIIAGERRWRACKLAGLKEIPVIIKDYTPQEVMEISLIENIQREDLNPIEEASAYERLIDEFQMKHEELAAKVCKSRAAITNSMRLLKLDKRVQLMLIEGEITGGHARALLSLESKDLQFETAERIIEHKLSVRETEKLVKTILNPKPPKTVDELEEQKALVYRNFENEIRNALNTKVRINRKDDNKGKIEIEYYSMEELERLLYLLKSTNH